jgi:alpha-beta hydrolase superfamily lysophospholipase
MIPFFFGASKRRLYGVYDAPAGGISPRGVVICYPLGAEYYYAHRACRSLARQLAGTGVHALRFDYPGTGDSAAETDEVRVDDWVEDVGWAVSELKEMADLETVTLVGLRVGAALAAMVAGGNQDVEQIALWDPISNPVEYVSQLSLTAFSNEFLASLSGLLAMEEGRLPSKTLLVCTGSEPEVHRPLADRLANACPGFRFAHHDEPGAWERGEDEFGSLPAPVRSLQTITEWSKAGR